MVRQSSLTGVLLSEQACPDSTLVDTTQRLRLSKSMQAGGGRTIDNYSATDDGASFATDGVKSKGIIFKEQFPIQPYYLTSNKKMYPLNNLGPDSR